MTWAGKSIFSMSAEGVRFNVGLWQECVRYLETRLPEQELNTWIRPLQAVEKNDCLRLLAPNPIVQDRVHRNFFGLIQEAVSELAHEHQPAVTVEVGTLGGERDTANNGAVGPKRNRSTGRRGVGSNLNNTFTFDSFVEGKSNHMAIAAARQVADNPGESYNPLFIYGGVGLGKTHLMHAVGHQMLARRPERKIIYLHSERFVDDMVNALRHRRIDEFKKLYRSVDALFIDDIQFFAFKEQSQEEFFHTFNSLVEAQKQIILTCDRYPREVEGLEERLKSRFGWGLTVAIEPPELETRVAILMKKAEQSAIELPSDVAFFIAKRIRSNVRELEGALRRVMASSRFTGQPITLDLSREALKDLLILQQKKITPENIQKTVADYYKLRVADLLSTRRTRTIARPRQIAMALAKELTNHSLPDIGRSFGGRDHTTVLHACRKIQELRESDPSIEEDYQLLLRILSG